MAGKKLHLHERLVPFRGPWHLPWIIERYIHAAKSAFTAPKVLNASRALAEMKLGICRVRSHPIVLRIEPCNLCNLRCPLCACGNYKDPRPKGMIAPDDLRRILDGTQQWAMITRLDGLGEPTLHPRIFELIGIAKSYRTSVVMHTNFDTPNCEEPERFLDCGLDRLVISVDGATQEVHERYRVGGDLQRVLDRMRRLVELRQKRGLRRPIIEMQTVDFPYNREQQPILRNLTREIGADRYQVTEVQHSIETGRYDPDHPKRCAWLWTVLTLTWNLEYRACTNAWSFPWPRMSFRDVPPQQFWNHSVMQEARRYNKDKSAARIAEDRGCRCNRCFEMLTAPLSGDYTCD